LVSVIALLASMVSVPTSLATPAPIEPVPPAPIWRLSPELIAMVPV